MVNGILQNGRVLYRMKNDDGDKSLLRLGLSRGAVNAISLKYSKEGRSSSSHAGIRNVLSDVCYDDTKY